LTEIDDFRLQHINYLSALPGLHAGFLTVPWLIVFLAAIGAACGWGERWIFRRGTPARMVLLAGATIAALRFEQEHSGMLVALRTAASSRPSRGWPGECGHEAAPATSPYLVSG
jgi:hypothetical protein